MHDLIKKYKVPHLVAAFILFWTPVIIFAQLADEILEGEPIGFDAVILQWLHSLSSSVLDIIFFSFTTFGNVECIVPITLLLLGYLLYKKQRRNALFLAFGVGGAALANFILKLIFQRDRPSFWQSAITETGYSFPSGHAMVSSALMLCLIVLLWNTRYRIAAIIGGSIVILMVGLSRLYFGVHYPTDILAGWSVSLIWVLIVVAIVRGVSFLRLPSRAQS